MAFHEGIYWTVQPRTQANEQPRSEVKDHQVANNCSLSSTVKNRVQLQQPTISSSLRIFWGVSTTLTEMKDVRKGVIVTLYDG